jgi:hypothetical protein
MSALRKADGRYKRPSQEAAVTGSGRYRRPFPLQEVGGGRDGSRYINNALRRIAITYNTAPGTCDAKEAGWMSQHQQARGGGGGDLQGQD